MRVTYRVIFTISLTYIDVDVECQDGHGSVYTSYILTGVLKAVNKTSFDTAYFL